MKLDPAKLVPGADVLPCAFRLGNLTQCQDGSIEVYRCLLQSSRHRHVHMIDFNYPNTHYSDSPTNFDTTSNRCSVSAAGFCFPKYLLNSSDLFRGTLSDFHSDDRKCFARKTIWPM